MFFSDFGSSVCIWFFSVSVASGSFLPSMIPRDTLLVFFSHTFLFSPSNEWLDGWMWLLFLSSLLSSSSDRRVGD
jgi:hypothetical protein